MGGLFDLLAGNADRFFEFAFLDQPGELGRTGHIGPLADHDEDAGLLGEGLRSGQTKRLGRDTVLLLAHALVSL